MTRPWKWHAASLLLVAGLAARVAWAETIEMVTYYPAPAPGENNIDRLHANRATIGDAYNPANVPDNQVPDGQLFVFDRVGIGTITPAGPLHVVGVDDAVSSVLFMPGADTPAAGAPDIRVGIGTATPNQALHVSADIGTSSSNTAVAVIPMSVTNRRRMSRIEPPRS